MGNFPYIAVFIFVIISTGAGRSQQRKTADLFELSVIHFNDFHARFEQTSLDAGSCKNQAECIGGFSRLYKQVTSLLEDKPNSILLNAGDNFQGTLWYNFGKWNVTQEFMNKLPIDAEVLGNHEFDDGINGIVPYIKSLKHPIVVSNIDDSLEPDIQGLYTKSTVIERNGKKIGIIGVLTSECDKISSTGKLKFFDESASVNKEAERLVAEEGVFTIIVLSHSGYDVDMRIAVNASEKIGLIVGGHSHTFLWTGDNPPGPDSVGGPYPTIMEGGKGQPVFVTQASAYSKYVGNFTVHIDENGKVVYFSGAPIFLDTPLPQDESINEDLKPWRELVDEEGDVVIGSTLVTLSSKGCYNEECLLGNFITDSYVYQYTKTAPEGWWTEAAIAFINAGGLRNTIEVGNITYSDLVTAQPFGNTIDFGQLEGKYIKEMLEFTVKEYAYGSVYSSLSLLQVSGLKIEYDLDQPEGQRIVSLKARCGNCTIPKFDNVIPEKLYNIAVPSFLVNGGDGFKVLTDNIKNKRVGLLDTEIYMDYLAHRSPVYQEQEGRITIRSHRSKIINIMK